MKLKEIITGSDNTFEQSVTSKPSDSTSFSNWLINTAKEHPYLMLTAATAAVATGGIFFYYSFYKKSDSN